MKNERAIEVIKNFVGCNLGFLSDEEYVAMELAIKALEEQPQGEWIENDAFDGGKSYICDECSAEQQFTYGTPETNNYNYCPCCGAKMTNSAK